MMLAGSGPVSEPCKIAFDHGERTSIGGHQPLVPIDLFAGIDAEEDALFV